MMTLSNKKKKKIPLYEQYEINNKRGFQIMKELFFKWYKSVVVDKNQHSNLILSNLIRWLCSENSVFYDPFLK